MNFQKLKEIRSIIQHINKPDESELLSKILNPDLLLSLTQPIFFDELKLIVDNIYDKKIDGDIIEAGVWSGATAIYLKALLESKNINKSIWLLDAFEDGFNLENYTKEKDITAIKKITSWKGLKSPSFNNVVDNFKKFDLWDDSIKIIKGDIFKTYTHCNPLKISILRIDLDFYESTDFMLRNFYERVSEGGYIIIDDYGVDEFSCKEAVDKFRNDYNITSELKRIGDFVAYWIK